LNPLAQRVTIPVGVAAFALASLAALAPDMGLMPLLGMALAAGLAVASVAPLWKRDVRRTPLVIWGMVIAHLGVAVSVAGMAS
ncbi:cytochrome c-type biogenesis CcmF C-terminal domain-containing protein, partial [Acinetobacter baumannii]